MTLVCGGLWSIIPLDAPQITDEKTVPLMDCLITAIRKPERELDCISRSVRGLGSSNHEANKTECMYIAYPQHGFTVVWLGVGPSDILKCAGPSFPAGFSTNRT
jgi:hypothetical protein